MRTVACVTRETMLLVGSFFRTLGRRNPRRCGGHKPSPHSVFLSWGDIFKASISVA